MRLRPHCLLPLLLLLFCYLPAQAQKEFNLWLLGPKAILDFNYSPLKLITDREVKHFHGSHLPAMADKSGRLLFYSDGERVFNRNGELMPNGSGLAKPAIQSVNLVPKPRSPFEYYVITTEGNDPYQALKYAVVDMRLNGGLGDVTQKGALLGNIWDIHTSVTGNCDNSVYWILINGQSFGFYAWRIDETGIRPSPVVSPLPGNGILNSHKVSPRANRIVWREALSFGFSFGDFDPETGKVSNRVHIPFPNYGGMPNFEFSSNGQVLYVAMNRSQHTNQRMLVQFDLSSGDPAKILASRVVVADLVNHGIQMQLGSDGRIYLGHPSPQGTDPSHPDETFLTVIHHPNTLGLGCGYDPTRFAYGNNVSFFPLPTFVTSFLREHGPSGIPARAGPDARVCQGQPLRLGDPAADPSLTYRWTPAAHLSDPTSPSPTFTYADAVTDSVKIVTYALTVSRGNCQNTDTVRVRVYPLPTAALSGTRSVCPRVEGVEYRVEEPQPGHAYNWQVGGGTITGGQGTAAVTVDWGPTNAQAYAEVVATSPRGCAGPPVRLPVRVNVELTPETPQGPDSVCLNRRQGQVYQVTNTPGSVYTWSAEGGAIASGQGSSRVTVDWAGEGRHRLWLQERSTTADTVCFGVSEPLWVTVFRDRSTLALSFVSVSLEDERVVEAHWAGSDPRRLSGPLLLQRRRQGESGWQQAASLPRGSTRHADPGRRTDEEVYEYRVETLNGCGEPIGSEAHQTVLLRGEGREQDGQITLSWNGYEGWEQGVERYKVWRRLDGEEQLRPVGQVSGNTLSYGGASGLDGFDHRFRVKAIARGSGHASWSNELQLEFKHELVVPNIFTPNGDGYNDTFLIPLLELYPENQLTVYSRWGQEVYRAEGYHNGWTGEGLSAGTYYYSLLLRRTGKLLKGWVEVVR